MAITASMVKELRERTGLGMMDCKRALEETDGDLEPRVHATAELAGKHQPEQGTEPARHHHQRRRQDRVSPEVLKKQRHDHVHRQDRFHDIRRSRLSRSVC